MQARENEILDDAVAAWRRSSRDESLSDSARTALFSDVRGGNDESAVAFVPSLTRLWRWAFLGSVPVVALAAVLITVGDRGGQVASPRLSASKVNGQLVFSLANGKTNHLVYRSTDPHAFDRSTAVKMARNQYTEDATGGPTLVFYRID